MERRIFSVRREDGEIAVEAVLVMGVLVEGAAVVETDEEQLSYS